MAVTRVGDWYQGTSLMALQRSIAEKGARISLVALEGLVQSRRDGMLVLYLLSAEQYDVIVAERKIPKQRDLFFGGE